MTSPQSQYAFNAYYIAQSSKEYEIHITVTSDLRQHLETVDKEYGGAYKGSVVGADKIANGEVSLILPSHSGDWELTPLKEPLTLPKSVIESYEPGKPIPHFTLQLKFKDDSKPATPMKMKRVQFTGVEPGLCVLTLIDPSRQRGESEAEGPSLQEQTLEEYKKDLARILSDGPDQFLLTQFKLKGWLIGPGPDPDVPGMVNVALHRIASNVSDYDVFIEWLLQIPKAKSIVEAMLGMCSPTTSGFTKDNVLKAVRNVRDTDRLGDYLGVPERRWRRIKTEFSRDRQRRLVEYIKFFMDHCAMASWRMVIVGMDGLGETEEADKIRHLAEPVQESTLTFENLQNATSSVKDWFRFGSYDNGLGVPGFVRKQINKDYKTEEEKKNALLLYFLNNVPMASWSRVAQALHYYEEETALLAVKEFLVVPQDTSFTPVNLSKVLDVMSDDLWQTFAGYVYIPKSKLDKIKQEYNSDRKCKEALVPFLLHSHPASSWKLIQWGLYQTADDEEGDDTCLKSLDLMKQIHTDEVRYYEAMSFGFVESGQGILIMIGVTGSGKSEFKRLALGQEVPEFSPSTPLAESAVRSMSVCQVAVDDKDDDIEWTIVGPQNMVNMVAATIKSSAEEHSISSQSHSPGNYEEMPIEIPTPPSIDTSSESYSQRHDKHLDNLNPAFLVALEKITIDKDLLDSMNKLSEVTTDNQLKDVDFIYLLDSGGQPAFREMLPHFVQQASAIVLMQKLNERLDFRPIIRYREEGGKVDKGYISQLTNEQILHQYVQAVQSHKHSRVFVIGTHRDREGECNDETREEKDEKLLEDIRPVLGEQMELYKIGNPEQLIFPVNCTSREADDEAIAREFRKRVMEKCMGEKYKIPLPWFILEQLLQSLAKEMNVSVLNIDECCEAAKQKLLMPRNVCEAALRYLGKLNIIFYRPDILPGVVFSSVQVVLDKITELVRCNHALRTEGGSSDAVPTYIIYSGNGLKFRECGLLDSELLNRAFPFHYRKDMFAAPDFLLLLERMLIAGRLITGEHFIPSLLPDLPVEKIAEYRATADHPPPLVIYYPKMWLPVGVMSSLVVYLQNQCRWVPAEKNGKPICMYHNCIQFFLPKRKRGDLVLIDSVKFLEVHVRPERQMKSELLYKVKDDVMAGLEKAHESLHYDPPETEIGWLCSGECGNKEVHLAMLDDDRETWTCTKNHKVGGELASEHQLWFKDDSPLTRHATPATSLTAQNKAVLKEKPTLTKLLLMQYTTEGTEEIKEFRTLDRISPHWIDIGVYLEVNEGIISNAKNARDQRESAREVMSSWILSTPKASWSRLIKAMKVVPELTVSAVELQTALLNPVDDSDDDNPVIIAAESEESETEQRKQGAEENTLRSNEVEAEEEEEKDGCDTEQCTYNLWNKKELNVFFMKETPSCQNDRGGYISKDEILQIANEWNDCGRDIVPKFVECEDRESSDIRVDFISTSMLRGHSSSVIGQDALRASKDKPTMWLNLAPSSREERLRLTPKRYKRIIRHEFGHALGLQHEHQHPGAPPLYDNTKLRNYLSTRNKEESLEDKIKLRWEKVSASVWGPITPYDPHSVMHLIIPKEIRPLDYTGPTVLPQELSAGDKGRIVALYLGGGGDSISVENPFSEKIDLMINYNLTEKLLQRICSEKHIQEISLFLSWKSVGQFLPSISDVDIDTIDKLRSEEAEKRLKLLNVWHERSDGKPTYDTLVTAILHAGKREEADQVLDLFVKEISPEVFQSKPTLDELRSMWSTSELITIIRRVAPWWRKIGKCLRLSEEILDKIRGDDMFCCESMFTKWLGGVGATWAGLLEALDQARFFELVKDIKQCLLTQFRYPTIDGASIVAKHSLKVSPEKPLDFNWENHGFKVHIPAGAISGRPVTLHIQASLAGMYQLPDDEVFVSGIYWLSLYPPVKKFNKKVTISLQHCAFNDDSVLSFATAKCTQKELPYTFKPLPGGDFCQPWNGTIEVESFSAFIILAEPFPALGYIIRLFYIPNRQRNHYDSHITVTQKKDLVTEKVTQIYKALSAKEDTTSLPMVKFKSRETFMQLDIPLESWMSSGWKLNPLSTPILMKEDLDGYKGEPNSVPAFQIELKMTESTSLKYKVVFKGIDFPTECFVLLRREPIEQEEAWPPSSDLHMSTVQGTQPDEASAKEPPKLPELLLLKIPEGVGKNYSDFGTFLLNDEDGSIIPSIEVTNEPKRIVKAILTEWLQGKGQQPVSWETLVKTLKDIGLEVLAKKVADKYLSS